MAGTKTNEREGTRAVLRHSRMSAFKVRPVLDLIRDKSVAEARDLLRFVERDAAIPVRKLLDSAVANAENNDHLDPEDLYVSACFADEGTTIKRWRPRARGRATRIRKRTCHVTIIVSRLPEDRLARLRAKREVDSGGRRTRRVAGGRRARRRDEQLPGTAEAPVNATAVEEAGIVDQQAAAVEAAEEAVVEEAAVETATAEEVTTAQAADEASVIEPGDQEGSADSGESTQEPAEGKAEAAEVEKEEGE
ncbi:MAG: 50S ribosomal protein L22 [Actinomycetota bacterium]|nr:50S ribosomal protein L22 [Actinomycetota bacterium]